MSILLNNMFKLTRIMSSHLSISMSAGPSSSSQPKPPTPKKKKQKSSKGKPNANDPVSYDYNTFTYEDPPTTEREWDEWIEHLAGVHDQSKQQCATQLTRIEELEDEVEQLRVEITKRAQNTSVMTYNEHVHMVGRTERRKTVRDELSRAEKEKIVFVYPPFLKNTTLKDQYEFLCVVYLVSTRVGATESKDMLQFQDNLRSHLGPDGGVMDPATWKGVKHAANTFMSGRRNDMFKRFKEEVIGYIGQPGRGGYLAQDFDESCYFPVVPVEQQEVNDPQTMYLAHMATIDVLQRIWYPISCAFKRGQFATWNTRKHPILLGLQQTIAYLAPHMLRFVVNQQKIHGKPIDPRKGSFDNYMLDKWSAQDTSYFTRKVHNWQTTDILNDWNSQATVKNETHFRVQEQVTMGANRFPNGQHHDAIPRIPGLDSESEDDTDDEPMPLVD